jgi:hypothetical protein
MSGGPSCFVPEQIFCSLGNYNTGKKEREREILARWERQYGCKREKEREREREREKETASASGRLPHRTGDKAKIM